MSRLRKGNKYKGAGFADHFKSACAMKSPLYEVAVAGNTTEEELPESPAVEGQDALTKAGAATATIQNFGPDDIPPKTGSTSRNQARKDWHAGNKEKAEDAAAEAERLKQEEEAAEALAETKRYRDADGNLVYEDDYDKGMTGKERRGESKQNKKQIKEEFRADKADIKSRRKSGEISRKEARGEKKDNRKEKKSLKKANRTLKKKARKGDKCTKKMKKKGKC
jgi:hypothetical protein